jgi:hypothetical protein
MYSPSARLAELVSTHLDDFFEAVEKEQVQVSTVGRGWVVILWGFGSRSYRWAACRHRHTHTHTHISSFDAATTHTHTHTHTAPYLELQVGLWQGDLHLQNLRLRSDALVRLLPQAPLTVHAGSVGSLHLKVR